MLLCLNNAFFSIVAPAPEVAALVTTDLLLVQARRHGDIERVFPGVEPSDAMDRDYQYEAYVERAVVAEAVAAQVRGIAYTVLGAAVDDSLLSECYAGVNAAMVPLQMVPPFAGRKHAA